MPSGVGEPGPPRAPSLPEAAQDVCFRSRPREAGHGLGVVSLPPGEAPAPAALEGLPRWEPDPPYTAARGPLTSMSAAVANSAASALVLVCRSWFMRHLRVSPACRTAVCFIPDHLRSGRPRIPRCGDSRA